MTSILQPAGLQPAGLKPSLEYKVERHGNVYVAGVNQAHFNFCGNVDADLYLDRMDGKQQVRLWRPRIVNPFNTETEERDKRVSEFYIDDVMLNWHSFGALVEKMNDKLLHKYGKKIGSADAEAFFSQAYEHYKQIADSIPR